MKTLKNQIKSVDAQAKKNADPHCAHCHGTGIMELICDEREKKELFPDDDGVNVGDHYGSGYCVCLPDDWRVR